MVRTIRPKKKIIQILRQYTEGLKLKVFVSEGLQPVNPFWANLPHTDIFQCLTPDIYHQLHKRIFNNHFVSQYIEAAEEKSDKINCCIKSLLRHPSLYHFKDRISLILQQTGNKFKNMEKVFLEVIMGTINKQVIQAVCTMVDFILYSMPIQGSHRMFPGKNG